MFCGFELRKIHFSGKKDWFQSIKVQKSEDKSMMHMWFCCTLISWPSRSLYSNKYSVLTKKNWLLLTWKVNCSMKKWQISWYAWLSHDFYCHRVRVKKRYDFKLNLLPLLLPFAYNKRSLKFFQPLKRESILSILLKICF